MRTIQRICFFGALMIMLSPLSAQDFLLKAKNYLDAGECDKARRAYDAYKVEYPDGNVEVEQRIAECKKNTSQENANIDLTFNVGNVSFKMVFVKGGAFQMGDYSDRFNESTVHNVTVSDFYIGEFEVTQGLWQEVMGTSVYQQRDKKNTSWPIRGVGENYPMYYVNYTEAEEFCGRINQRLRSQLPDGYRFALPTEAEWEYAARGGDKSNACTYSDSNYLSDVGWYEANSSESTHTVGTKRANELGLYDMSGNVTEWCEDWYEVYSKTPETNPRGPSSGISRVRRGSYWGSEISSLDLFQRRCEFPSERDGWCGFRLALVRR